MFPAIMSWPMTGVNSGQGRATTWVMMWAMTWATGTMVTTTPATMPAKGMAGTPAERGGGGAPGGGHTSAVVAAAVAAASMAAVAACFRGHLLFIVKIFMSVIFMCGGNWRGQTFPRTLVTLEVCRRTSGWDGNYPQKLWYVNTQNYLAK